MESTALRPLSVGSEMSSCQLEDILTPRGRESLMSLGGPLQDKWATLGNGPLDDLATACLRDLLTSKLQHKRDQSGVVDLTEEVNVASTHDGGDTEVECGDTEVECGDAESHSADVLNGISTNECGFQFHGESNLRAKRIKLLQVELPALSLAAEAPAASESSHCVVSNLDSVDLLTVADLTLDEDVPEIADRDAPLRSQLDLLAKSTSELTREDVQKFLSLLLSGTEAPLPMGWLTPEGNTVCRNLMSMLNSTSHRFDRMALPPFSGSKLAQQSISVDLAIRHQIRLEKRVRPISTSGSPALGSEANFPRFINGWINRTLATLQGTYQTTISKNREISVQIECFSKIDNLNSRTSNLWATRVKSWAVPPILERGALVQVAVPYRIPNSKSTMAWRDGHVVQRMGDSIRVEFTGSSPESSSVRETSVVRVAAFLGPRHPVRAPRGGLWRFGGTAVSIEHDLYSGAVVNQLFETKEWSFSTDLVVHKVTFVNLPERSTVPLHCYDGASLAVGWTDTITKRRIATLEMYDLIQRRMVVVPTEMLATDDTTTDFIRHLRKLPYDLQAHYNKEVDAPIESQAKDWCWAIPRAVCASQSAELPESPLGAKSEEYRDEAHVVLYLKSNINCLPSIGQFSEQHLTLENLLHPEFNWAACRRFGQWLWNPTSKNGATKKNSDLVELVECQVDERPNNFQSKSSATAENIESVAIQVEKPSSDTDDQEWCECVAPITDQPLCASVARETHTRLSCDGQPMTIIS